VAFQWVSGSRSAAFHQMGITCYETPMDFEIFQMENGNQVVKCVSCLRKGHLRCGCDRWTEIASGSEDNMVRLRDMTTAHARTHARSFQSVCSVAFSPDCSLIASGSYDKTVRIWSALPTKYYRPKLHIFQGHSSFISLLLFHRLLTRCVRVCRPNHTDLGVSTIVV